MLTSEYRLKIIGVLMKIVQSNSKLTEKKSKYNENIFVNQGGKHNFLMATLLT